MPRLDSVAYSSTVKKSDMPDANPPALPVIDPSRALVEEELLRLAASRVFARAARQLRFLRHLVERTLGSDTAALREMALGVAIFHRSAERFDPRSDSIVRVEARRLRHKLARYYADDGADARLQFVLPTGGYLVEFHLRTVTGLDAAPRSSVAVVELVNLGGDEHRPLLAAIARELNSALSRLNGIRVVAYAEPASSDAECRRIARLLATETVLPRCRSVTAAWARPMPCSASARPLWPSFAGWSMRVPPIKPRPISWRCCMRAWPGPPRMAPASAAAIPVSPPRMPTRLLPRSKIRAEAATSVSSARLSIRHSTRSAWSRALPPC